LLEETSERIDAIARRCGFGAEGEAARRVHSKSRCSASRVS
jgi:transcriptional regulator GlxA family with amidase domain